MSDKKLNFRIGGNEISINDLGHSVNEEFISWYQSMLGLPAINMSVFKEQSFAFFNSIIKNKDIVKLSNCYFENFTPIWKLLISQRRFKEAEDIWKSSLDIVHKWEGTTNLRLHKGTPYYFWAVTCFLADDLDKGFWLMNQAYIEDLLSNEPETPAKYFLYFETTPEQQFFRGKLLEIKDFLNKQLIENYTTTRSRNFNYSDFEKKFLKDSTITKDVKFHFNLNIFRLEKILKQPKPDERNTIASLFYLEIIFDLCRVFEYLIKKQEHLFDSIKDFAKKYKSSTPIINLQNSQDFNTNNFIGNLQKILNNSYKINNNNIDELEKDILVTFGFRNFGAHEIKENKLIIDKFEEIIKRIINAILLAVELKIGDKKCLN